MKIKLLIIFCLFFSCAENTNEQNVKILHQDDFSDLLKAVHLAEAEYESQKLTHNEKAYDKLITTYDSIYKKYNINSMIFSENLTYFADNPEKLEKIYSNILEELKKEKSTLP